jgi:FAD/FMN-containing dehydrogenase
MEISQQYLDKIKSIVGLQNYLDDEFSIAPYLQDWGKKYTGKSAIVCKPETTSTLSKLMEFCNEFGIGVVPQGGNTGLVGGGIPSDSGAEIVISLEKMNKILDIDPDNFTMTLEAGCILFDVQEAAKNADRMFPLSLASEGSCQIGGNLSTNAGGTAVLKYGNIKELVLGIEVVLADGSIINQLKRLRKDNTGYDIKQLFLGSEGTLGIITKAVLKLFPLPLQKSTSIVATSDLSATINLFSRLRALSGDNLTAVEYMDRACIDLLIEKKGIDDLFKTKYKHYVLIEYSSSSLDRRLSSLMEASLSQAFEEGLAVDAVISNSEIQSVNLWKLRETLPEAIRGSEAFFSFDISVPVSLVPDFIATATAACYSISKLGIVSAFGHIGDGNIHFYFVKLTNESSTNFLSKRSIITSKIYDIVAKMEGSFSAEHGIGVLKKTELESYKSNTEINLMRQIKNTLDPKNIMNPGKVL